MNKKKGVVSVLLLVMCLLGCSKKPDVPDPISLDPNSFRYPPLNESSMVEVVKFDGDAKKRIVIAGKTDTSTCLFMKPLFIPEQVAESLKFNEKIPYIALDDNYYLVDWKRHLLFYTHYSFIDEEWTQLKDNNRCWSLSHLNTNAFINEFYAFKLYSSEGGSLWAWSKNDSLKNCVWFGRSLSTAEYTACCDAEREAYWQRVHDADSLMIKVIKPILNEMIEEHALRKYAFKQYIRW